MKHFNLQLVLWLIAASTPVDLCGLDTSNILPGVRVPQTQQPLSGRLVFLYQQEFLAHSSVSNKSAVVCEFDLATRRLRTIVTNVEGELHVSPEGNNLCIISDTRGRAQPIAFCHSDMPMTNCIVTLRRYPDQATMVGHYAFFWFRDTGILGQLENFDILTQARIEVEMPAGSGWEYSGITDVSASRAESNTLHFRYDRHGKRVTQGIDYRPGYYDYRPSSGTLEWSTEQSLLDSSYRVAGGQFVYFKGKDSPIHGFDLVTSSAPNDLIATASPNQVSAKLLHRFSAGRLFSSGWYTLDQISPNRELRVGPLPGGYQASREVIPE